MAQSFFQKIDTLIKANLHAMVDKALDSNSVAVLDEYIRQAEDNLQLDDYSGLGSRQPLLAVVLTIFLLSLAGFPGTGVAYS